jgi:hypothetical protein
MREDPCPDSYYLITVSGVMLELSFWTRYLQDPTSYIGVQWAFYTSTILFNAYTTCAIGYKVLPTLRWNPRGHEKVVSLSGDTHAIAALLLFLENGALYTIVGIIYGALLTSSNSGSITIWYASLIMGHIWDSIVVSHSRCFTRFFIKS